MADRRIQHSPISVPQAALDNLRERLHRTRWPDAETVGNKSQGTQEASLQALIAYWRDSYDWRRCESMLNGWNPNRTVFDGLGIHFFHIRSHETRQTDSKPSLH